MRKRRRVLLLYSLLITMLATLAVLAVSLRPEGGWLPLLKQEWEARFGPHVLNLQPLAAPTPHEPSYQIKASFDRATNLVHGQAKVTLPELKVDEIPFYLYVNGAGAMQVHDVTLNGHPAQVTATAKQVTVHAAKSASPQTVTFAFDTKLPASPARTGTWKGVSTVSYWYPILAVERNGAWVPRPDGLGFGDPFLMDLGNYAVEWNAPSGMQWFATGVKTNETPQADGRTVTTWKAEKVQNFALVGGTGFHVSEFDTGTGTHVYVGTLDAANLQKTYDLAWSAVKTYSTRVGIDPYPVLNVLELPQGTVYAHELPNMALFSQDLWGYPDADHWIAHEIGHAWFYNAVGNYEVETPWLDEGLADYLALLERETRLGQDAYVAAIRDAWDRFRQNQTYSPYPAGTPSGAKNGETALPYGSYHSSQAHYYYSYLRPILMYHDLRKMLGDDKFFKFLRQYYVKNVERTATRTELEQALADIDPNAVPLLKQWLDMPNNDLIKQVAERF